ncbi:hypothetical protein Pmani_000502 [Petrolisthes manimaculis]|uniref:Spaetzle domain-containing protein n=1 Tax=Petrolisthes manimaculis TaxID=1843537 RepID=A0AAE1QPS0_9EUCA|nr:hypothetical protein Pmani_000502 [Petrolisthes manimaculis]
MRLRGSMIIVLVACLLMGWVRSQESSASLRSRRLQIRRRVLERLAERGLSEEEREIVAEEIMARLDSHMGSSPPQQQPPPPPPQPPSSTTTTTTPHTHHHNNNHHHYNHNTPSHNNQHSRLPASLELAASRLIDERPSFQEIVSQIGPFPDLEEQELQEEMEEEQQSGLVNQYISREEQLRELLRNKRGEVPEEAASSLSSSQEGRNRKRGRKSRWQQEREGRRDAIRNNRRKRKKKLAREVRRMINAGNITLHEDESGEQFIDCCPSRDEYVNVTIGKTDKNRAVEIHPGFPYFRERVCLPHIENKECIFPRQSLRSGVVTRCKQQYAYSQALSRMYLSTEEDWKIHFIKLKSGCSCQVAVNHKKKKRRKRKR